MHEKADWLNDPEYVKLLEFLVEKTKEVKTVFNVRKLAREFKQKISSPLKVHCLEIRILRFRPEIHKMPHLNTETKVKLMFGLNGPVDYEFLKELRKDADVTVDNFNRIIHYKKNGEGLELKGIHREINKRTDWLNDPEYVKLLEFLVEKTRGAKTVLNVNELAREFKEQNGSELNVHCFVARIRGFRLIIHKIPHLDTETKVKLMFGLSASVDRQFLRELQDEAKITVDEFNRITHYKKNDGGLELKGKHKPREAEMSNDKILEFLARKVEGTSGIIAIATLAKQLKAEIGSSLHDLHLTRRIREATKQIYESELFDEEMKVKIMFATRRKVEDCALKELQENAHVVVDDNNRILEYEKNDGSLNLKTEGIRRVSFNQKQKKKSDAKSDDEGDSEEEEDVEENEESGGDSEGEEAIMEVTTRSGRISKKRFSDAFLFNDKDDIGPSSSRNERSNSSNTPTTSNKKRKILDHVTESTRKKKNTVEEIPPEEEYDNGYSLDISYHYNDNTDVTLEPFNGTLSDDTSRGNIINNRDDFVEEIPAPTENFVAPKYEELLMEINSKVDEENSNVSEKSAENVMGIEKDKPIQQDSTAPNEGLVIPKDKKMLTDAKEKRPEVIIFNDHTDKEVTLRQDEENIGEKHADDIMKVLDDSMEMSSSNIQLQNGSIQHFPTSSEDVKKDDTSLILILESFHDFINILDLPILSDLQKKIEAKLEKFKRNSKMVPNQLIYFSLELCLLKVNENCAMEESVESFRLETFIRHLRHAVVHLKCPSLSEFQEKLKKIIGELRVQDKFIPVTAIRSALQDVTDNVIDF